MIKMRLEGKFLLFAALALVLPDVFGKSIHATTPNGNPLLRSKRYAVDDEDRLWKEGIVPYYIDYEDNFSSEDILEIEKAMRHWEEKTCILFVKLFEGPLTQQHIRFRRLDCGCCSYVGRTKETSQIVSLGHGCVKFGIIIHELGHVLGFHHEHSRPDRDEFVKINYDNVINGTEGNFEIKENAKVLGTPYDFASVMHYHNYNYAQNISLDGRTLEVNENINDENKRRIGQRNGLSILDIVDTNALYKCPSCGGIFSDQEGSFSAPSSICPRVCVWKIAAHAFETIILTVTTNIKRSPGCEKGYLDIKNGYSVNSTSTGRTCGDIGTFRIQSKTNYVAVVLNITDAQLSNASVSISYKTYCGGYRGIGPLNRMLVSPSFPYAFPSNRKCVWSLSVDSRYAISVEFLYHDIKYQENCSNAYVKFTERRGHEDKEIAKLCGKKQNYVVNGMTNKLRMEFYSGEHNDFFHSKGFIGIYYERSKHSSTTTAIPSRTKLLNSTTAIPSSE